MKAKLPSIPIFQLLALVLIFLTSCTNTSESEDADETGSKPEVVIKKRDDGTLSSVNQVDEMGLGHGLRVTYFDDGKTIYSRISLSHGLKQGPSIRYYRNGQIFEHANFELGKKQGLTRKYHKNGALLSECEYEAGHPKPGLKEYREDGSLISSYPEVTFKESKLLSTRNRVDLQMSCRHTVNGVKYYRIKEDQGKPGRIYLISEHNAASMQFYVRPGETLHEDINLLVEIPTEYGNIFTREINYKLKVSNTGGK